MMQRLVTKLLRNWSLFLAITMLILAFAFQLFTQSIYKYSPDFSQVVNYEQLVSMSSGSITSVWVCIGFWVLVVLIGLSGVQRQQEPRVAVITIAAMMLAGIWMCSIAAPVLISATPSLEHRDTIQFDNRVFHLAVYRFNEGDIFETYYDLLLYECDLSDTQCQSHSIIGSDFDPQPSNVSLVIDPVLNQLQVMTDDRVVFKLSPSVPVFPR